MICPSSSEDESDENPPLEAPQQTTSTDQSLAPSRSIKGSEQTSERTTQVPLMKLLH